MCRRDSDLTQASAGRFDLQVGVDGGVKSSRAAASDGLHCIYCFVSTGFEM